MKSLLRNTIINSAALFSTSQILSGVKIEGGLYVLLLGGIVFYMAGFFMRPVLKLVTLPFNMATFGFFSFLINVPILYILTIIVPQIKIDAFTFQGVTVSGFVVPKVSLNTFFAFIVASVVLSAIISGIKWMMDK